MALFANLRNLVQYLALGSSTFVLVTGATLIGVALNSTASAWKLEHTESAYCNEQDRIAFDWSFTNQEPDDPKYTMDLVVTEVHTNQTDTATLAPGESAEGTFTTEFTKVSSWRIKYEITWTNGMAGYHQAGDFQPGLECEQPEEPPEKFLHTENAYCTPENRIAFDWTFKNQEPDEAKYTMDVKVTEVHTNQSETVTLAPGESAEGTFTTQFTKVSSWRIKYEITWTNGMAGYYQAGDFQPGLECDQPPQEIEVCRDGKVITIPENERRDTDTDPPCPEPVVACESLTAVALSRTVREFTVTATVQHATITGYAIDFGDGSSDNVATSEATATFTHDYEPGEYTVSASVAFDPISEDSSNSSKHCEDLVLVVHEEAKYDLSLVKEVKNTDGAWVDANDPETAPMFESGDTVYWRVTVNNDLETTATNVSVTDIFPSDDLNFVSSTGDGTFTPETLNWAVGDVAPGGSYTLVIKTTVKETNQDKVVVNWAGITSMNEEDVDSVVDDDIDGNEDDEDPAYIRVKAEVPPEPVATCNGLVMLNQTETEVTLQVDATVENTTVTAYVFNVNGTEVQNSASDTFVFNETAPGSYEVTAVVVTEDLTSEVGGCMTTIVIQDENVLVCTAINTTQLSRTEFAMQVVSFTAGNASVDSYELVDEDNNVIATSEDGSFSLTQEEPGDYTVRAYVLGSVNDEDTRVTSDGCVDTVTVEPEEVEPPLFVCTALRVTQLSQTKFAVNPTFTEGADPDRYVYEVNGQVMKDGSDPTFEFVADEAGTYRITLLATQMVDGEQLESRCDTLLTVVENETVRVLGTQTPTTPTKSLPNTGPGQLVTILLASILSIAMVAHYTARHLYIRQFTTTRS